MELETKLEALATKIRDRREILLTEEAAKTALVMPFLAALGYDVFDPAEVVPEFTCDVGTKKGEKVDYAICIDREVKILVECKPATEPLNSRHMSQLYRYFSVTNCKFAILTNGCEYQVFSDLAAPNRMDDRPFFTFSLTELSKADVRTLAKFQKAAFDEDGIVKVASTLQLETTAAKYLRQQMVEPDDDFVRLVAGKVQDGRITEGVRAAVASTIVSAFSAIVKERIKDRFETAFSSNDQEDVVADDEPGEIITTQDEIEGFHIVRAIAAELVAPKRVVMRDAKSYCAVLLDDNNRKTIARLWFNSPTARYLGTFAGKDETRHGIADIADIYQHAKAIKNRIDELCK